MDLTQAHASARSNCSGLKRALGGALRMKVEARRSKAEQTAHGGDLPARLRQFRGFSNSICDHKVEKRGVTSGADAPVRGCKPSQCFMYSNSVWSVVRA